MDTMLVRLKSYDPKKGLVLRRFTYSGIKFQTEHGWYRVEKSVADYLKTVHQNALDANSPLAFDVMTDEDARALEAREQQSIKKSASDTVPVSQARSAGTVTTTDLPEEQPNPDANDERGRNKRKG